MRLFTKSESRSDGCPSDSLVIWNMDQCETFVIPCQHSPPFSLTNFAYYLLISLMFQVVLLGVTFVHFDPDFPSDQSVRTTVDEY